MTPPDKQENKLRPCPACGSKAEIHPSAGSAFADRWVFCSKGKKCITEEYRGTTEEAIKSWNNFYCWKIIDQDKQALAEAKTTIKELVEALEKIRAIRPLIYSGQVVTTIDPSRLGQWQEIAAEALSKYSPGKR